MAMYNVPQYIDVEDKVAGPLTGKQLLWMFGMGAVLLVLYNLFEFNVFFAIAIPVVLIFCAFAFYRPYNQPLITFVTHSILYMIRPKLYVWGRPGAPGSMPKEPKKDSAKQTPAPSSPVTLDKIKDLSNILDQRR